MNSQAYLPVEKHNHYSSPPLDLAPGDPHWSSGVGADALDHFDHFRHHPSEEETLRPDYSYPPNPRPSTYYRPDFADEQGISSDVSHATHPHPPQSRYDDLTDEGDDDGDERTMAPTPRHLSGVLGDPIKYPPPGRDSPSHSPSLGVKNPVCMGAPGFSLAPGRPPVWKRMIWDRTDLEQKIHNHKRGIGVQDRGYVSWLLSLGMLVALILELVANTKYQGTPISTKPSFNYMIGPSPEIMIHTGARFTPCIKFVSAISNVSFPCLNSTSTQSTCVSTLEEICGLGGFKNPNKPDQTFRFILPMFLHAGVVHYLINIYVQMTSSALIERQMGSLRFLLLYLPSGIFGFILGGNFSLVGQPSVGVSGAIFSTHAAILVDLVAHWSIEYRPGRKLGFLLFEIIAGLLLGLIPGIDNFSHIGGFSMGLLLSIVFFPVLHQTRVHRFAFYSIRAVCFFGSIIMFAVLYRNFFTDDPAASCKWCRYLSCWPTSSNNRCQGTGLSVTTTTVTNGSSSIITMVLPMLGRILGSRLRG